MVFLIKITRYLNLSDCYRSEYSKIPLDKLHNFKLNDFVTIALSTKLTRALLILMARNFAVFEGNCCDFPYR